MKQAYTQGREDAELGYLPSWDTNRIVSGFYGSDSEYAAIYLLGYYGH